ncbi:MAG TPA: LysR family transcriptional regulator [Verrucomicrobiae bacterium]|nr:LysR family transcriptional regulator [Verrucomicrobiae bacterium]
MIARKLEYLIALARERHFAHAAAACQVSQPTLSAGIRQLESEMGVCIVQRGPRFHGLTEDGERVLAFAQLMASGCERLREELSDRGGDLFGTLRVGVIPSAIPLVPILTIPFHKRHARVNLKIVDLNPPDVLRALEDYSIDVAITYIDEEVRGSSRTHPLYAESYALLIKKGALRAGRKSVSWDQASRLPLCLLAPEMHHGDSLPAALFGDATARLPHIETNSISALYSQVRSGAWSSVLPRSLARVAENSDDLEMIPLPKSGKPVRVGVIIPDRDTSLPVAEAFFRIALNAKIPWARRRTK